MAHLTVAVSEDTFRRSWEVLKRNFVFEAADDQDFGAFSVAYDVKAHLEGGDIDFRNDGTILIDELDIKWDRVRVTLGLDIPEVCVGGGCIPVPFFPDICIPRYCLFDDDPDVSITVDLAAFLSQELSLAGGMAVRYFDASLPLPSPDLCAPLRIQDLPDHNAWQLFIDPDFIDVDVFDFADIVGDIIEDALTAAIEALLPDGAVLDLLLEVIGGVTDVIRDVLDIGDDLDEWLSDLFNFSFGLGDMLGHLALEFLGTCNPVYSIEDPLEVMPEQDGLIPVTIPVRNLSASVNNVELVIQADVGA